MSHSKQARKYSVVNHDKIHVPTFTENLENLDCECCEPVETLVELFDIKMPSKNY